MVLNGRGGRISVSSALEEFKKAADQGQRKMTPEVLVVGLPQRLEHEKSLAPAASACTGHRHTVEAAEDDV